ncbi:phosphotransferase [Sphingobacterium sp. 2149]|uniref:phosphotransferase n=1 Tax=Sphingobacterium sp. 2149 TaxID=2817763 RepID=UPI00285495A5|nr:phosphotransferase [Sphingobacterium sp. 2149]MDR6736276.1 Ser/Thr protein kinase RdoA (MazF antagonist) [Sphingobacterium sp. 2149]
MSIFPVITSVLSEKNLGEFIKDKYDLSDGFHCTLFRTGVNHTYFISDKKIKYVVRVYCHGWRTKNEIQEELWLLKLLKENSVSVSFPIPDKENNLIQEINAPEGQRYIVLFSYAEGEKMRFMDNETCYEIGSLMARLHTITSNKNINRINYNSESLLNKSYELLKHYFSEDLSEMKYLKEIGLEISNTFQEIEQSEVQKGIVHLDIWYDNVSVNSKIEITIFDFDNCGNGFLFLDIGYFFIQLFHIELNKEIYESKVESFLSGYRKVRAITKKEIKLIPEAGAAIFAFYLGVQAQRFDWSNIFLTENYLKMFVGRIKTWKEYYASKK